MIIDLNIYLIAVIIVMLIGIVLGMRRILSLEDKITYILDLIKNEEDNIDRKVSYSMKKKASKTKVVNRKQVSVKKKKK